MSHPAPPTPGRWQLPAAFGVVPVEGEVADRMVGQGIAVTSGFAALFAAIYQVAGPVELVGVNVAAAIVLGVLAAARPVPSRVRLYAAVLVALVLLGSQLAIVGTVVAGITVWFLVPNVAALLAGLRQAAAVCLAVSITEILGVYAGSQLGWFGPPLPMPSGELDMALSMVGTLLLCALFAAIVLRVRTRLIGEVQAVHAEVERARAAAEAASAAKDAFFANLTHEIRTPLNGIAGTAELLREEALPAGARALVDDLGRSTASLVAVVNAMLDHARLRAGAVGLVLAAVDLRAAADEIRSTFAGPAAAKGLRLEVAVDDAVPAWVQTDAVRVQRIVANLVGNAVRFTTAGHVAVRIGWQADPAGTGRLIVGVADTGPGIPPDRLEDVFEPFVQGDASIDRSHGGTGLGLAIGRQLATLLGGTLEVASEVGAGTTFTLTVPAAVAEAPAPRERPATPAVAPGARVLLAEDNPINVAVEVRMLTLLGATVEVAANGAEAVAKVAEGSYQLVLMDLQMPVLDGISAARAIRAAEAARGAGRVPIIAMTGNAPEEYGDACGAAGMDGFLTKPVGLDALRACLGDLAPVARA